MLSAKLIQLIESHWGEITARLISTVRSDARLTHLAKRSEFELREWARAILANLDHYLTNPDDSEVSRRYRMMGRLRFEEQIPLREAVLRLQLLHESILNYVREQGYPMTALQLYSEEELERRMRRFFGSMTYHIVSGYEDEMRRTSRLAS